jgi:integrase/recombinase XerD
MVKRNPMEIFKNGKEKKRLPRYLTFEQQKVLLLASQDANFNPLWVKQRNELMVLFLLDTGVRISELCHLETNNINLGEGIIKVLGKGNKEREVVISDRLGIAIEKYLTMVNNSEIRESTGPLLASRGLTLTAVCTELGIRYCAIQNALKGKGWEKENMEKFQSFITEKVKPLPIKFLFFNEHGKIICQRHAMRIIKEIGQKAGIEGLHPHILRHSFATNLRERGADLLLLKESLGHASIMTTQIYAHIGNGKYKSELRKFIN